MADPVEDIIKIEYVLLEKVHPSGWNPNEQDETTFNELTKDIETDGFDEPIIVVEDDAEPGTYRITSGEHRWKAMKVLGRAKIPVIVKKGWDEVTQKIKTVRRNLLKGALNPQKFTKLVNDIKRVYDVDHAKLSREMGFVDEKEYWRAYKEEKQERDDSTQGILQETRKELTMIDNLSVVLNEIFSQYGETVPQSFIFFVHKKKIHLLVSMEDKTLKVVEVVVAHLKQTGLDVNVVVSEAFRKQLADMGVRLDPKGQVEPPPGETLSDRKEKEKKPKKDGKGEAP